MNTFDADGRLAMGQSWFEQFEQKQQERFRPNAYINAYHQTQRDMAATYSQGYRQNIATQRPEGWWQSMVLNAVPVLGQGKMFIETLIEKDLATGQRINPYEHAAWTVVGTAGLSSSAIRAGAYSAAGMSGSMATMGGTMGLRTFNPATQLTKNQILKRSKIQGDLGEAAVLARLENSKVVDVVGTQIKVTTPGVGKYRQLDILVRGKKSEKLWIIEVKTGNGTRDTVQLAKDKLIADPNVATKFFGDNAAESGFPPGTPTGSIRTFEVNASNLKE